MCGTRMRKIGAKIFFGILPDIYDTSNEILDFWSLIWKWDELKWEKCYWNHMPNCRKHGTSLILDMSWFSSWIKMGNFDASKKSLKFLKFCSVGNSKYLVEHETDMGSSSCSFPKFYRFNRIKSVHTMTFQAHFRS